MNDPFFLMDRRAFLRMSAVGIAGGTAFMLTGCNIFGSHEPLNTVEKVDFRNPLYIPPLAEATRDKSSTVFDLELQRGHSNIVAAGTSATWGINGPFLGPTLRARRGESVTIHVKNALDEPTTWHWHGMHLPAAADGGPHQMINPGETWSPSWTINQPAATLWYHPHPHGTTERHMYRGLSGLFILDDDDETALSLPRRYGIDDFPVIVQDKTFDAQGQLVEARRHDTGMLGSTILLNGTAGPILELTAQRSRLRILNASTARSYAFGFSDDRDFMMIASDGGLLHEPVALTRLLLTPGERAEIILEMLPGETTTLRSYPQDLGLSENLRQKTGASDTLDILRFRTKTRLTPSHPVPVQLASVEALETSVINQSREFELGNNRINGKTVDMTRIDEVVTVGTTEVWEVWNDHQQPHNFHIHDVQFQILDVNGQAPPPELAGWKDTVYIPPDARIRLILRFTDYTDATVPYMYHCHLLWHEDQGMMGQFLVVEPGQTPPAGDDDHEQHG